MKTRQFTNALDIACGKGEFIGMIKWLTNPNPKITCIDMNDKLLNFVKQNNPDVETVNADAYKLPFDSKSFDLVCLSNSLHHFDDPEKVVAEMKRVLNPKGCILIQEMVSDSNQSQSQKSHIAIHHFCARLDRLTGDSHHETWNRAKLRSFIKTSIGKSDEYEYSYPVENPHDEKLTNRFDKALDFYLKKVEDHPDYESLKKESDDIREKLKVHGFSPATEMMYLFEPVRHS